MGKTGSDFDQGMHEQMTKRILPHKENWLAAEYALGVLDRDDMAKAEAKYDNEITFRHTVDDWHTQFEPFLDDVEEVMPSKAVWQNIDKTLNPGSSQASSPIGIWKFMTALASTAAVAAVGALMFITGGDFTGHQIKTLEQQLAAAENTIQTANQQIKDGNSKLADASTKLADTEVAVVETTELLNATQGELSAANDELSTTQTALSQANEQLASAQAELTSTRNQLVSAEAEISEIRRAINESEPLVASLSQSGDAPSFVAQFDPLKGALLIRTTLEDDTEKVPEIWLIPSGGPREGEVLSLGVMDEAKPDEIKLGDEFTPLVTEGGTLAITMEPPGGAPNGVATGPIIALGKLQALKQ